jgi:hypothetical protein
LCHQILDQQGFNKNPRLPDPAARNHASSGASHQGLRVDAKQMGRFMGIEGARAHDAGQVE